MLKIIMYILLLPIIVIYRLIKNAQISSDNSMFSRKFSDVEVKYDRNISHIDNYVN